MTTTERKRCAGKRAEEDVQKPSKGDRPCVPCVDAKTDRLGGVGGGGRAAAVDAGVGGRVQAVGAWAVDAATALLGARQTRGGKARCGVPDAAARADAPIQRGRWERGGAPQVPTVAGGPPPHACARALSRAVVWQHAWRARAARRAGPLPRQLASL